LLGVFLLHLSFWMLFSYHRIIMDYCITFNRKLHMRKHINQISHKKKVVFLLLTLCILFWILLSIPPFNMYIVLFCITLVSFSSYLLSGFFVPKKQRVFIALFIFALLSINGYVGFNILNCILLFSLLLSLLFLVQ